MLSDLKIINPLDIQYWDEIIHHHANYSFFHSSYRSKVLQDTYNYKPYYFTIEKEGMLLSVVTLMIVNGYFIDKRVVSLPFSDYYEPLIFYDVNFNMDFDEIIKFIWLYHYDTSTTILQFRFIEILLQIYWYVICKYVTLYSVIIIIPSLNFYLKCVTQNFY